MKTPFNILIFLFFLVVAGVARAGSLTLVPAASFPNYMLDASNMRLLFLWDTTSPTTGEPVKNAHADIIFGGPFWRVELDFTGFVVQGGGVGTVFNTFTTGTLNITHLEGPHFEGANTSSLMTTHSVNQNTLLNIDNNATPAFSIGPAAATVAHNDTFLGEPIMHSDSQNFGINIRNNPVKNDGLFYVEVIAAHESTAVVPVPPALLLFASGLVLLLRRMRA